MSFLPLPEVSEGINPVLPEEMVMDSPEAVPLQDKTGSSHDAPDPASRPIRRWATLKKSYLSLIYTDRNQEHM